MLTVGYLVVDPQGMSAEERAAWAWLSGSKQLRARRINAAELAKPSSLAGVDILWWHSDSSTSLPQAMLSPETKEMLTSFLRRGGGMLLSLLAATYVVELGIESVKPTDVRKGAWGETSWAEDYPDIRGFGGFLGHPVFAGLGGGVFTWNPVATTDFVGAYYTAPAAPRNGKIIAVERQYIRLNEDRRVLMEYEVGSGKLLAAGTFMFFVNPRDRFRVYLERFTENCLGYVSHARANGKGIPPATHWSFAPREVRGLAHEPIPVTFGKSLLPDVTTGLSIKREPQPVDHVIGVGGLRMMVMGKEKKGIEEVWCHPFRLLHGYRVGVRLGEGNLTWLDTLSPVVTVRPESVTRVFMIGEARIEETIFSSQDKPSGAGHYHIDSNHQMDLVVTASVDLRLMWPLSESATGSLLFSWNDEMQGAIITNGSRELVTLLGCSRRPDGHLVGRYSEFGLQEGRLSAREDPLVRVGIGMQLRLDDPHTEMLVAFAGSDSGESEALSAYRAMMEDPGSELKRVVEYYDRLFGERTVVQSADAELNEGYCWAMAGTDRFFVETPKLGRSLMAGFGTTERGWDGNQKISGRPGYAWYFGRDGVWTAFAMLDYGDFAKVRDVLEFFGKYQDLTGKIYHELTTSGQVHYDAADSTPLYLILMGRYLEASGDVEFVREEFLHIQKALEFCASTDTDGDGLIENTNVGHGWVEGGKLFPVHTEIYLAALWAEALGACAVVAKALGKRKLSEEWSNRSESVRKKVRKDFWNPATKFYNFGKHVDGSYNTEKTVLPAVATYFGCTAKDAGTQYVEEYARATFSADWGARIVGTDCSFYNPRGYHTGSVWPLFTGWASLAEFESGRPVQGYLHLMSNLQLYRPFAAGYIEEVLRGDVCDPAGVCSHQAWSESMVLQPLLEGMLGLKVNALQQSLTLRPYFPPHWDHADISNIRVGETRIGLSMMRGKGETRYKFTSESGAATRIMFRPLFPPTTRITEVQVGGKILSKGRTVRTYVDSPELSFRLTTSAEVVIRHSGGVGLVPPVSPAKTGEASQTLRVLEERWMNGTYEVEVEGIAGDAYDLSVYDPEGRLTISEGATITGREDPLLHVSVLCGRGMAEAGYVKAILRFTGHRKRS